MKRIWTNIRDNPLTIVLSIVFGGLLATGAYFACDACDALPFWADVLIACAVGVVAVVLICWLGWDTVTQSILRKAKAKLTKEDYAKLVEDAEALEAAEVEAEEKAEKEAERQAEEEEAEKEAEALIAEYEAEKAELAEKDRAYAEAKRIVNASKNNKH